MPTATKKGGVSGDSVLVKLHRLKTATTKELGATASSVSALVTAGYITAQGYRKTGKRGRPGRVFTLTSKGRSKAARLGK